MFSNYLKVAWRNLLKSKGFSFINIFGLAAGLACFILISLYVVDELSYDKFNSKADRIYRIHAHIIFGGTEMNSVVTSDMMGATLKKDYPQIENFTRIYASSGSKLIKKGNEFLNEPDLAHVDSTFFDVFSFTSLYGDTRTALTKPNAVVLSESAARKYFGSAEQAMGKTLETDDQGGTLYKVTAVIKDMPKASHFHYDFLFSIDNVDYGWGNYLSHNFHTYLLLKPGANAHDMEANFSQYIDKYVLPQAKQYMEINSMEEFKKSGNNLEYALMPLLSIHLHSNLFPELGVNGSIQYVYIFAAVALFVLLIACINFMNLSTARSSARAREVGIRKVLGTERKDLIRQFLTESMLTVLLALLLAIFIAMLVLPLFNTVAAKSLTLNSLLEGRFLLFLGLLPLVVGLLAGSYPAFYLSRFNPIVVLKGKLAGGVKRSYLRSGLVIFQFTASIVLIIGTIVVYRQLNYISTTKIGYNKEQVLVLDGTYSLKQDAAAFRNEVLAMPGVVSATFSSYLPVSQSSRSNSTFSTTATMTADKSLNMQNWRIDEQYLPTLGMELAKGRNFSKDFPSDSTAILLNETAAAMLGDGDPIGKLIYSRNGPGDDIIAYHVVGVVKNFNFESLRQSIAPLLLFYGESRGSLSCRINTTNAKALIAQIGNRWKTISAGMPFQYRFLDDSFDQMYRSEQRIGKVILIFSVIAILVACLGLFGLATYIAEQRTKEIGIRKVLGASVSGVVGLLSRDFLMLVAIAFVVAIPVSWYFMSAWLQDFAYRVNLDWWVFAFAGMLTFLIALFTVSFQAIKAALMNPVKSLRSE